MMTIKWSMNANNEIRGIAQYIKKNFGNPTYLKFRNEIKKNLTTLSLSPNVFAQEKYLADRSVIFRSVIVNNINKLIYYVDETNNSVNIIDVWDTRRNPETLSKRI